MKKVYESPEMTVIKVYMGDTLLVSITEETIPEVIGGGGGGDEEIISF